MNRVAIINTVESINKRIKEFCGKLGNEFEPIFLKNENEALEYLSYELPEITVFNFSDTKVDMYSLLEKVKQDPWLHYAGVIGIYGSGEEEKLQKAVKLSNIISLIKENRFNMSFIRVLRIVKANRQILFQRHIQNNFLRNISGSFIIDNDPFDIIVYSNLVTNYLFNSNFINEECKEGLNIALNELLLNAIEHGNCKITYEEKSEWLNSGRDTMDLIREKNKNSEVNKKKVNFKYKITPQKTSILIKDEGDGFDWQSRFKALKNNTYDLHGRGIKMSQMYVANLKYNVKGNAVYFEVIHQTNESNLIPEVFTEQKEVVFKDNETVFFEGEESNFLYYIVSGRLKIISNNKLLSMLSPADIFLGEMSFLLNNRRSTTVISEGKTVLIKISKEDFLKAVKRYPYYSLFLARLLAQRLDRLNQRYV